MRRVSNPPLTPTLSPLAEGGEGAGVGGSKLLAAFVKFGAAIDIISGQPQGCPYGGAGNHKGCPYGGAATPLL
jgi:hypothetical protein